MMKKFFPAFLIQVLEPAYIAAVHHIPASVQSEGLTMSLGQSSGGLSWAGELLGGRWHINCDSYMIANILLLRAKSLNYPPSIFSMQVVEKIKNVNQVIKFSFNWMTKLISFTLRFAPSYFVYKTFPSIQRTIEIHVFKIGL